MSYIAFEIPERFLQGIAMGTLERYGALIKDVSTGQIIAHLREVIPSEEINKLSENVLSIGKQIGDIQNAQKLMAASLGAVGLISVVGFMFIAKKLEQLKAALQELGKSLEKTHREVEMLRLENAIALTRNYYNAKASSQEGEFDKAADYARKCSADIESYLLNMPIGDILANEEKLEFLMRFLLLTMKCQIESAAHLPDMKIHLVYQRYGELFKNIEMRLNYKLLECRSLLPGCAEDVAILRNIYMPHSFTNRLVEALPECYNVLAKERDFLELCDRNKICHGTIAGKECLVVLSEDYNASICEAAAHA